MESKNYIIGIDAGIGSVGWSVISGEREEARIENFGVRIFDSGENAKKNASACQERRGFRSVRRLTRRRYYRKMLLRNIFNELGLIGQTFEDELLDCKDKDVYTLKVSALDGKISIAELYKCLVHTCNHRGYRDFYENTVDEEDGGEEGKNKEAVSEFAKRFKQSGKRTVSEFLLSDYRNGKFVDYRNNACGGNDYLLIERSLLEDETRMILAEQQKYYSALSEKAVEQIVMTIFNQRAFEDGPGDKNDAARRYQGYLATVGNCPFHKDERRGFRCTVIADAFAVINTLSQYRFLNTETGEFYLNPDVAKEILQFALSNAGISIKQVKDIAKKYGLSVFKNENSDKEGLKKSLKFLPIIKKILENNGESWEDWIGENQFDLCNPSRLHLIGDVLSKYQTPRYRREKLADLKFLSKPLANDLVRLKATGTAKTGYTYMCEAIEAFCSGDIYGNFQANVNKAEEAASAENFDKLPQINDEEINNNHIVFKAINETRKVINAIVETYGAPKYMVIEVADELGRSFSERDAIRRENNEREKTNRQIEQNIRELLGCQEDGNISEQMIERYKLFYQQEGKDPYSGTELGDIKDVLNNALKQYEIDHIVPYSLILDNTLSNKILTHSEENQRKKQRTPLMYLDDEKAANFLSFVNHMYARDNDKKGGKKNKAGTPYPPFNGKKLEYCKLADIYSEEARKLLSDWKSRNINDTRYITKYIAGFIAKNLKFSDDAGKHVFTIKGAVTSKFRREWMRDTKWGEEEKNRDSYLNHAMDAVIMANLTPAYIEIGSDAIKLRQIYNKNNKNAEVPEYKEYFANCVDKMEKYYHFSRDYTAKLLRSPKDIPSYVPDLKEEVLWRFNDESEAAFSEKVKEKYGDCSDFIIPPHIPITSHKPNRKFKGCIADANPIKIVEVDGEMHKVSHTSFSALTKKDIANLYGADPSLIAELNEVFKDETATGEKYLKENGLTAFRRKNGQILRRVSVIDPRTISNYHLKTIEENNHTYLGGLKYYCVGVYRNQNGKTCTYGIRYVDIVKKDKKLFLKAGVLPEDYHEHIMYLFPNDYIEITNKKGKKITGFYKSVNAISRSIFYFAGQNTPPLKRIPSASEKIAR